MGIVVTLKMGKLRLRGINKLAQGYQLVRAKTDSKLRWPISKTHAQCPITEFHSPLFTKHGLYARHGRLIQ